MLILKIQNGAFGGASEAKPSIENLRSNITETIEKMAENSDQVTVYEIELEDEHYDSGIRGIDENVKKYKEDLFDNDIKKPKLIFRAFQSTKINVPKFAQ
ncbi:unnamed protein product, partial [Rotaria sp. Silwood2]